MAERYKIFELDIDIKKLLKSSADAKKAIEELKKAQKSLNTETEEGRKQFVKNEIELNKQKRSYKTLTNLMKELGVDADTYAKATKRINQLTNEQATSVRGARESNKSLLAIRNNLNVSTEKGIELRDRINRKIDQNNTFIKRNVSELEKQKIGIGSYEQGIVSALSRVNIFGINLGTLSKRLFTTRNRLKVKKIESLQAATATGVASKATKGFSASLGKLKLALLSTGIGALIVTLGSLALLLKGSKKDFGELTEKAKGVEFAFKRVEGGVEVLNRARKATRGLVSDLDIKSAINTFKNFKLDLEPFPELLQFVATRAAQTGESFEKMLSSLVEGLSKESKLRIDNLGISQLELNKELERTPNFVQAVANIARKELSTAGAILDAASNANQRWNVALENFNLRIRQGNYSAFTKTMYDLGSSFLELITPVKNSTKAIQKEQIGLNALVNSITETNISNEKRESLIVKLNEKYPFFLKNIADEKADNESLSTALEEVNALYVKRIALQSQQDKIEKVLKKSGDLLYNQELNKIKVSNKLAEVNSTVLKSSVDLTNKSYEEKIRLVKEALIAEADYGRVLNTGARAENNAQARELNNLNRLLGESTRITNSQAKASKELSQEQEVLNNVQESLGITISEINDLFSTPTKTKGKTSTLSEEEQKELQDRLDKQKAFRDEVLFNSKTIVEQEKINFEQRLKDAGIYGIAKENLTADQQKVLEVLKEQHRENINKLDVEATNDFLSEQQKKYDKEKKQRKQNFNNQIAQIKTVGQAKKLLQNRISKEELSSIDSIEKAKAILKREHEKKELHEQEIYLNNVVHLLENTLTGDNVDGLSLADSVLSEEEKENLNDRIQEVLLLLSQVGVAKSNLSTPTEGDPSAPDVDLLGFNPAKWEEASKIQDEQLRSLAQTEIVLQSVQGAWGLYSDFVAASEQRQLNAIEKNADKKRKALKRQLDSGIIDQKQYNKRLEGIEAEADKERSAIEYKSAKREKVSAIASIVSNTATGILKSVAASPLTGGMPWAAVVGAIGALQAGLVLAQPLPPKLEQGGLVEIGGKRHSQGGTKFVGEDGTQFEAERGELIGVMNRDAAQKFMLFNDKFRKGVSKPNYFAEGGIVQTNLLTNVGVQNRQTIQMNGEVNLNDQSVAKIAEAVANMKPQVAVTDIREGIAAQVEVEDGANI